MRLQEAGRIGVALYADQDLFVPATNADRDYTMGLGVEVFEDRGPLYLFGDLLDLVEPILPIDRRCGRVYRSFLFGSVNYTPDDIGNPAPIHDDRPYASLLYLANKQVVGDEHGVLGVELAVGVLGLDLARQVQTGLHSAWRGVTGGTEPVEPRGWQHQISDGGEPTARLRVVGASLMHHTDTWDAAWGWEANLGFQTNAALGLSARAGRRDSVFWSVPYDPINRGAFVPALGGDEFYLWSAARLRAVAYDATLQGQFRHSPVTVDRDDMRSLVWEAGVGVTRGWSGVQLTFAVNAKAGDTRLARAPDEHVWGGLYLSWAVD